ncbi:hypothetical protein FS749_002650, partial [Ceratobasidium sp. UAMH 11750]
MQTDQLEKWLYSLDPAPTLLLEFVSVARKIPAIFRGHVRCVSHHRVDIHEYILVYCSVTLPTSQSPIMVYFRLERTPNEKSLQVSCGKLNHGTDTICGNVNVETLHEQNSSVGRGCFVFSRTDDPLQTLALWHVLEMYEYLASQGNTTLSTNCALLECLRDCWPCFGGHWIGPGSWEGSLPVQAVVLLGNRYLQDKHPHCCRALAYPVGGKIQDIITKRTGVQDETKDNKTPGKRERVKGPRGNTEDHNNLGGLGVPTELLTTVAITRADTGFDISDTSLLNNLCERLGDPDLYTRPITRQRIIRLLEAASKEIAKTRAAGLWEVTARVAQELHFVCPPQVESTVKSYIKMVDTMNENLGSFYERDLIAQLGKINQSKPFQVNIPANIACLFCRRRKIKCDRSLPRCDMCTKHRQAKCEYPQKSQYGGFSNQGGLHYVVPTGLDIAATVASAAPGASPPVHLDPGKPVKGYAPDPTVAPAYTIPGPPPSVLATGSKFEGPQRADAPAFAQQEPHRDSYTLSTDAPPLYNPIWQSEGNYGSQAGYSSHHDGHEQCVNCRT